MQIAKDSVVRFHYRVSEPGQAVVESSHDSDRPLTVLVGHGGLIRGLEQALIGHAAGDHFEVEVAADDAYGPLRENFTQRVAKKYFREAARLKPGMQVALNTDQGPRLVTVLKVGMSVVDVDLNHPMAGKSLHFEVDVVDVRAASAEEISHGHVHGEGGVEH